MRGKFAVLGLFLVVALASLSLGYAYWSETLYINGSVSTGNLDADFGASPSASDGETTDVGTCTASVGGTDPNETLTITVGNAYPGYSCTIGFTVLNSGSIPVKLTGLSFTGIPSWLSLTVADDVANSNLAVSGSETGSIVVSVPSSETGNEGASYTINATITATQFNAP